LNPRTGDGFADRKWLMAIFRELAPFVTGTCLADEIASPRATLSLAIGN